MEFGDSGFGDLGFGEMGLNLRTWCPRFTNICLLYTYG